MDEHKIPIEELYARLGTDPTMVVIVLFSNQQLLHVNKESELYL